MTITPQLKKQLAETSIEDLSILYKHIGLLIAIKQIDKNADEILKEGE